jgi:hypothetical protein
MQLETVFSYERTQLQLLLKRELVIMMWKYL